VRLSPSKLFEYILKEVEAFVKITKFLKDIFREVEVFLKLNEHFIKTIRLFEDFSEKWRLLFSNVGL
jgi:hypothetical protein